MAEHWNIGQPETIALGDTVRSLRLTTVAGRINLIGTDGPPTLEVTKVAGDPVRVELDDGALTVRHSEQRNPLSGLMSLLGARRNAVELSLALPPDTPVDVQVVSGPVVVSNFHEAVNVKGVSGELTLAGVHGVARIATVSGAISAEQSTGDLSVKAISGTITVIAGAGGTIDLTTVSGAITLDLENPFPSRVKLQCVSGSLTVRLPHSPDVSVDLGTASGRAASAFPQLRSTGTGTGQRLSGTLGAGTARLTGKTVSGAVTVLRRRTEEEPGEPWTDQPVADRRPTANDSDQDSEDAR